MIKDLTKIQENSKYAYFSQQLVKLLKKHQIEPTPSVLAAAFNKHYKTTTAKPHTVRKWLLGQTQPKSETLLLLSNWLEVDPKELISQSREQFHAANKVNLELEFRDQDVISKYLSMTVKQKLAVRFLIDAISDNNR